MRLIEFAWKNLFRRPIRTGLTVTGVAVAVGAVVALVGIADSFEKALLSLFQQRGVDLVVLRKGGLQKMNSVLDEDLGPRIRSLPDVRRVSCGMTSPFSFPELDVFGVMVRGMPAESFLLEDLEVREGRLLRPGDGRVAVLGPRLADSLQKRTGDTLELVPGEIFRIVGVYESRNHLESSLMIVPLAELQRLLDLEGKVTAFNVIVDRSDPAALGRVRRQIESLAPHLEALPLPDYVDSAVEIRLAKAAAWMTSALALILGTIGMVNTMLTAVFERTRELCVLRAVGWRRWRVMELILLESVLLGLAGAIAGTLLAIGLTQGLSRIPAAGRMVAGDLSLVVVLQGFALALLLGVAGGLYPAVRAAGLMPTDGLRHE